MKICLLTGITALLILSSCSMERRIYSRGVHIEWGNGLNRSGESGVACRQAKKAVKRVPSNARHTAETAPAEVIINQSTIPSVNLSSAQAQHNSKKHRVEGHSFNGMSKNQQLKGRSLFFNNIKNESSFNSPIDGIYDTPEVEDPSIAGFLFGLTCILLALVFGALFIPFILAIVGVVTSMIGLIQDAGDQYVTGIILAMFGLAMCGFVLIYLYPIIGPVAAGLFAFFIANPGVFISLLLLLGLYLLMNGF